MDRYHTEIDARQKMPLKQKIYGLVYDCQKRKALVKKTQGERLIKSPARPTMLDSSFPDGESGAECVRLEQGGVPSRGADRGVEIPTACLFRNLRIGQQLRYSTDGKNDIEVICLVSSP